MRRLLPALLVLSLLSSTGYGQIVRFSVAIDRESTAGDFDRPYTHSTHSSPQKSWTQALQDDSANINVTQFPFADQTEPSIAIDPTDPKTIVIGANDDRNLQSLWVYTSHDGGRTWLNQMLPPHTTMLYATDPSVAFDRSGMVYFLCGRMDDFGIPFPRNDVVCYRSTDHGDTWELVTSIFSDSTIVGGADTLADKYYVAVDNAAGSPHVGRVYGTWVDQGKDDTLTRIVVAHSDDSGLHWTHRRYVMPDLSFYHSPVPSVGPNGELYISYIDIRRKNICVAVSIDGGENFDTRVVSPYTEIGPVLPPNNNRGYPTIKGNLAVNSFPSIAVDPRPEASGAAYIVWAGLSAQDQWPHIWLSTGTANGTEWSTPRAIDGDHSAIKTDKFFPWVAVDPISGHVGVDYYDSRNDTSNRLTDLYLALSTNGGQSFEDRRISTQSMDPTIGRGQRDVNGWTFKFFGDYIGLAGYDKTWHPAWCDARSGDDLDMYTAAVPESTNGVPVNATVAVCVYLTANGDLLVQNTEAARVSLEIVDVLGRSVKAVEQQSNGAVLFDCEALTPSPLFYRVVVDGPQRTVITGRLR